MSTVPFLLVSRHTDDARKIKLEIERNKAYKVIHEDTADGAIERIKRQKIGCLVFNFESFTVSKLPMINTLRDMGYNFPVMIFAAHVQREALEEISKTDRSVVVERPFEAKDVWGLAQKLLHGSDVFQRVHRRFYTNQNLILEQAMSGELVHGCMYNLSKGGAYVEMDDGNLKRGDMLKVTVFLDKVSRSYSVDAQIVWKSEKGAWQGKPAIGIQFITQSDVYRNLLEKL